MIYWDVRLSKELVGERRPPERHLECGKSHRPRGAVRVCDGDLSRRAGAADRVLDRNRSLNWDFRPPSSGRKDPASEWEGLEYRLMVEGVHKVLKNLDKVVPGYTGQGYEITGFVWWQGHKDSGSTRRNTRRTSST